MLLHIVACTEDTSELGISLDQDKIDNGYESYEVTTKSSLLLFSIPAHIHTSAMSSTQRQVPT